MAGLGTLLKVIIALLPYIAKWVASYSAMRVVKLYESSKRQKERKPSDRDALRHFFDSVRKRKK